MLQWHLVVYIFWIIFFSRYMPRSGIPGSYGSSVFIFYVTSILSSIVSAPIYIPTNILGGFLSLHTLPKFTVCGYFEDSHSSWCEEISHWSFDLHFSNNQKHWTYFHVSLDHLYALVWETTMSSDHFLIVLSRLCFDVIQTFH